MLGHVQSVFRLACFLSQLLSWACILGGACWRGCCDSQSVRQSRSLRHLLQLQLSVKSEALIGARELGLWPAYVACQAPLLLSSPQLEFCPSARVLLLSQAMLENRVSAMPQAMVSQCGGLVDSETDSPALRRSFGS